MYISFDYHNEEHRSKNLKWVWPFVALSTDCEDPDSILGLLSENELKYSSMVFGISQPPKLIDEISNEFQVSQSTVRSHAIRASQKVRNSLIYSNGFVTIDAARFAMQNHIKAVYLVRMKHIATILVATGMNPRQVFRMVKSGIKRESLLDSIRHWWL